jgi:hypothetical protein
LLQLFLLIQMTHDTTPQRFGWSKVGHTWKLVNW